MRTPLPFSDSQLQQLVAGWFGVLIDSFEFIPIGECSWAYRATTPDGTDFLVKVVKSPDPAMPAALECMAAHNYKGTPQNVPSVSGPLWVETLDLWWSLQEFVPTARLFRWDENVTPQVLGEVGSMLAGLHALPVSSALASVLPAETFHDTYVTPAAINVARLSATTDPDLAEVRSLLAEYAGVVTELFSRSRMVGTKLAARSPHCHMTHGDVHFANVLERTDGRLFLIDWDSIAFGLPERDLMFFSDYQIGVATVDWPVPPDPLAVEYYRMVKCTRALRFWAGKALLQSDPVQVAEGVTELVGAFQPDGVLRMFGVPAGPSH